MYVKNDKGNVVKVTFGDTSGLRVKLDDKQARKIFASLIIVNNKKKDHYNAYWSFVTYQGKSKNLD